MALVASALVICRNGSKADSCNQLIGAAYDRFGSFASDRHADDVAVSASPESERSITIIRSVTSCHTRTRGGWQRAQPGKQPGSRALPAGTRGLPLPGEVVADVGVAVGGIMPQALVEWKRVIKLVDLRAGVIDGRGNVDTRRWLGQRQRWRA